MKQTRLGKRVAAWLLCLAMVMTAINLPVFTVSVRAEELCEHSFGEYDNGFRKCSECGAEEYETASYNEAEEVYEIGNAGQLYWFADKYNNAKEEMQTLNAKLTENITVNTNVLKTNEDGTYELNGDGSGFKKWTPIGTSSSNTYSGNFDGNGKTISGLYCRLKDGMCAGFMGYLDGTLHNITLEDIYIEGYRNVGGAVGICYGSTIDRVSVSGVVYGKADNISGSRFGGVFGYTNSKYAPSISNCCFIGDVSGKDNAAGLGGAISDSAVIRNCYVIARVQSPNIAGVVFGDGNSSLTSKIFSCVTTDKEDINREYSTELPLSAFTSGEVAYRLNAGMSEDQRVWRQNLPGDTYPNLNPTHSLVYEQEEGGVKTYSNTPNNSLDCRHLGIVKVDGYNYYHCDLCEKDYREQEAVHELKNYHKAVANSCTEDGMKEYWTYDAEGVEKYFDGQNDVLYSELIISAPGHDFENGTCTRCKYMCTHLLDDGNMAFSKTNRFCSICGGNSNCGAEGENGDNMYWYCEGDTLYVVGSGKMKDYHMFESPWYIYKNTITKLVLKGTNIQIGKNAFYNMGYIDSKISGLKDVEGFENVTSIGYYAFSDCLLLLGTIDLRNATNIGIQAFEFGDSSGLENHSVENKFLISENVTIDIDAFYSRTCIERIIVFPSEQNRDNVKWNSSLGIGIKNTKLIFLGSVPPNDLKSTDSGNTIYYDKEDAEAFDNLTTLKANNTYIPMTYHEAVEPTCTEKGHKAYWSYEEDGVEKYFDETGYDVEALTDLDIPIKHEFENGKCKLCGICHSVVTTGNHDFSKQPYQTDDTGKHYQICANCTAETEHEACTAGKATCTTKATLTTNGKLETKCTVCNNVLKTEAVYAAKTVMLDKVVYTYDGKTKKPSVIIKDSKGKAVPASNYTVTYPTASKKVGEYTVKVTFKGNYKGSKSLTFKINPVKTAISSLTAGSKSFTVKWAKKTAEVTGYQIQYSTSDKFKTGNKTVAITKNGTVKKQIKKLKAGKKYFVRIRTYKTVGKVKFYSEWSAKKAVTTKK